jgi:hypothetical protein
MWSLPPPGDADRLHIGYRPGGNCLRPRRCRAFRAAPPLKKTRSCVRSEKLNDAKSSPRAVDDVVSLATGKRVVARQAVSVSLPALVTPLHYRPRRIAVKFSARCRLSRRRRPRVVVIEETVEPSEKGPESADSSTTATSDARASVRESLRQATRVSSPRARRWSHPRSYQY